MNVMRAMGVALREGFRGGDRMVNIRVNPNGTVTHGSARYSYGILRGISPNGEAFQELHPRTISLKREAGSRYATQPLRLRPVGDDMALINSTVVRVYANRDGVALEFKDGEMNERSKFHEKGGRVESPVFESKGKAVMVHVPARPHRKIQRQAIETILRILTAWNKKAR